ncbi:MAG: matrixin family metalloprotease [Candidatus Bathyarchaeota archaeon]|nr:matrixin family metalloprotease [Candidatus Bathyarchaeum sp.]
MKKIFALLFITTVLISIPLVAAANSKPAVTKIVFIHRVQDFAKPEGVGKPAKDVADYEFLPKNVKWTSLDLEFVINPTNDDGLSADSVATAIIDATNEWDLWSSANLFYDYDIASIVFDSSAVLDTDVRDGKNEIVFGTIDEPNAIAMCVVWGVFVGPPSARQIVEFDIIFNDEYYEWGNADDDSTVMDLQNIVTHELGHALGLADLYDSTMYQQTMYGYATYGETIKRDLYDGDKAGIVALYG